MNGDIIAALVDTPGVYCVRAVWWPGEPPAITVHVQAGAVDMAHVRRLVGRLVNVTYMILGEAR